MSFPLNPVMKEELKAIYQDLGIDEERHQRSLEVFKDWIRCQPHLPDDIGDGYLFNFLAMCKDDLTKAKEKFEKNLIGRKSRPYLNYDSIIPINVIKETNLSRTCFPSKKLTPEEYRVLYISLPDPKHFDQATHFKYSTMIDNLTVTRLLSFLSAQSEQLWPKTSLKEKYSRLSFSSCVIFTMNPPLDFLSAKNLEEIFKKNDLENDKIKNRLELIKKWLTCENYLPNNVGDDLLKSFIYGCKGNLETIKSKLKKYLIAKTEMTLFFQNRQIAIDDHLTYPHYRSFYVSRKQSPTGNRLIVMRMPSMDLNGYSYLKICKHVILALDLLLYFDKSLKYDFIYDAANFTGPLIAKTNITLSKHIFEVVYNIMPYRTNSISVINTTPGFNIFMNVAKPLMPKKIKDRMNIVKICDLPFILPLECLPEDYGGKADKLDDRNQEILDYLIKNGDWCRETEKLKLSGCLPDYVKKLYSFEECTMDGSFRSLSID